MIVNKLLQQQNPIFSTELPVIGNFNKEYVPIFAMEQAVIPGKVNPGGVFNDLLNETQNKYQKIGVHPISALLPSRIFSLNTDIHGGSGIRHFEELEIVIKDAFLPAIDRYLNLNSYSIKFTRTRASSYDALFSTMLINDWNTHTIRDTMYITNLHFCGKVVQQGALYEVIPLFSLVIKPEFMSYVRLAWLMGEEPDPSVFELWVNPDFDHKDTDFRYLRSKYLKIYLPNLKKLDIEVLHVKDMFDKLFYRIQVPSNVTTLKSRKEWVSSVSQDAMLFLKNKLILSEQKINLIL